ncbi:Pyroglutamyl peptidase [Pisciglobus halotolerans]|uniref:Pyroglutamyl-peptidase I n=1 Tax=Pisciglobus halotolerans TaxID=745365 RepID=A0A1I3CU17_9LACT|nr:Pyroglutamyl peptidase [Pisciglobus halotolerans]
MVTAVREAGIPSGVSNTAGTFVCNHIMYQVQYMIDKEFPNIKGGFIHVPFIPEQVINKPGQPAMSLTDMTKGLTAAIEAIVAYDGKEDLKAIGAAPHIKKRMRSNPERDRALTQEQRKYPSEAVVRTG